MMIMTSQLSGFKKILYDHQLECISQMQIMETKEFMIDDTIRIYTNSGILAEKAGSGKSQIILGLIFLGLHIPIKKYKILAGVCSYDKLFPEKKFINTSVIVYPDHLRYHWETEVKFTNLKYHFIHSRKDVLYFDNYINYNVVFISQSRIKDTTFDGIIFNRLVIDEADTAPNSKRFPDSYFIWFMTSNIRSFSRLPRFEPLKFMNVKELEYLVVNTGYEPIANITYQNYICKPEYSQISNNHMTAVAHYLSINDPESAILNLNGEIISRKDLKKYFTGEIIAEPFIYPNPSDIFAIHKYKEDKKAIRNKITNINQRIDSPTCGICFDDINIPTVIGCCKIAYCAECIAMNQVSLELKCPTCSTKGSKLFTINDNKIDFPKKIKSCINIVEANTGGILIYTKDIRFYRDVVNALKKSKIKFIRLGKDEYGYNTKYFDLEYDLNFYNKPTLVERKVILLYSKTLCGISLSNTSNLVIDGDYNEDLDNILDRINRLDRPKDKTLTVHKLLNEGYQIV